PPRRRGGHAEGLRDRPRDRNTPASAGRTGDRRGRGDLEPEHPRVGGEDRPGASCGWWCTGTPPRRRGGLDRRHHELGARRNTPASAGRTFEMLTLGLSMTEHPASAGRTRPRPRPGPGAAEHPRVGGEDTLTKDREPARVGTPPRRRGGRRHDRREQRAHRNTPASAGRTTPHVAPPARPSDPPRVGGEDTLTKDREPARVGTPPRRRGGRRHDRREQRAHRNTPASAGRTTPHVAPPARSSEHPRVGGEDVRRRYTMSPEIGTPPR